MEIHKAHYCKRVEDKVKCLLCPRGCLIAEGAEGGCRVRGVRDGQLIALGYGKLSSAHLDPIEKKPLNEFRPGSMIFSIGGWGCNLGCSFCQNWSISQEFRQEAREDSVEEIIREARLNTSVGIAYTYNEPLISFEFIKDCCIKAKDVGLVNVLVTNGYINSEPAAELLPLIDALNIDIKSMSPDFYKKHCQGSLHPVLDFAIQAKEQGSHVEITNLVIPGLNDKDALFADLARWIALNLGSDVPLHLSAYRPQYKMKRDSTPVETLLKARDICTEVLHSVYLGNVPSKYL